MHRCVFGTVYIVRGLKGKAAWTSQMGAVIVNFRSRGGTYIPWGFLHNGVCGNGFIGLRRVGVESIDLESRLDGVDYRRHRSDKSLKP